jgi:hypothetical protein
VQTTLIKTVGTFRFHLLDTLTVININLIKEEEEDEGKKES